MLPGDEPQATQRVLQSMSTHHIPFPRALMTHSMIEMHPLATLTHGNARYMVCGDGAVHLQQAAAVQPTCVLQRECNSAQAHAACTCTNV